MKNILVSAGSTQVPIDQVRCLSNIFRGRTGNDIAIEFGKRGNNVILLTSSELSSLSSVCSYLKSENIFRYKTYDDLYNKTEQLIINNKFDIIVWSAAVSDYKVDGTFYCTHQEYLGGEAVGAPPKKFELAKMDSSKKISSSANALFLKLVPTEKIIDKIRDPWGFKGILVKFKLQVGMSDEELINIATKSMHHSDADIIVANCLEWAKDRAYIISDNNGDDYVSSCDRNNLPSELYTLLLKVL